MNHILLLEDEESVNRGISFSLQKSGYEVTACFKIEEAKLAVSKKTYEIIVCDINLPDGNGFDFIKWVRAASDAYIICLTALDQELDQVMGYEAGADDYITKPFSLSILLLKIEAYLKRNQNEKPQDRIISGRLTFYKNEMKLMAEEEEIPLTKNEWKMLSLFMEHPKQILSKKQILEAVFDIDGEFVDENTLAVNIRRLREKIELSPAKPEYIKNIRGLGYIWDKECSR